MKRFTTDPQARFLPISTHPQSLKTTVQKQAKHLLYNHGISQPYFNYSNSIMKYKKALSIISNKSYIVTIDRSYPRIDRIKAVDAMEN
jgi:hypothetical protein